MNALMGIRAGSFTTRSRNCRCGQQRSLQHIFQHLKLETVTKMEEEAQKILQEKPEVAETCSHLSLWKASPSTCTGWVYGSSAKLDRHPNRKAIVKQLRKAILGFVIPFIEAARHFSLEERFEGGLPQTIQPAPLAIQQQPPCQREWELHTDVATSETRIGIGIVITHNGNVWYEESDTLPKDNLPAPVTSTIGEYHACTAGLKRAGERLPSGVKLLYHYSDNKAVVLQADGDWHTTSTNTLQMVTRLRQTRRGLPFPATGEWIPRDNNKRADELAKKGLTGVISDFPKIRFPIQQ